jgi:transcription elongation factor Elf1
MERLFFTCPVTRRSVDVGVETEIDTLLRIKSEKVRAQCPACGQIHEWTVREASLPRAA